MTASAIEIAIEALRPFTGMMPTLERDNPHISDADCYDFRVPVKALRQADAALAVLTAEPSPVPPDREREIRAGSLDIYADGVSKLADTSKTDDGWLRALALALRDAAALLRQSTLT